MSSLRALVKGGRLILDEPTTLPEGTVLDLVLDDEGDDLEESDRRALHAAILRACQSIADGRGISADEVIASFRKRG